MNFKASHLDNLFVIYSYTQWYMYHHNVDNGLTIGYNVILMTSHDLFLFSFHKDQTINEDLEQIICSFGAQF